MPAPLRACGNGEYVSGENHLFLTTTTQKRDGTVTGAVYCHARGGNAFEAVDPLSKMTTPNAGQDYAKTPQRLAQAGVPVISVDMGGTGVWGNDTALSRITSAFTFMQTRLGVRSDRLILVGTSMGTIAALNYARANPALVRAVGAQFPAIDMNNFGLTSRYQAEMNTAYTDNAGWLAGQATHNPLTYAASMRTVPTRLLYSASDDVTRQQPVIDYAAAAAPVEIKATASAGAHVTSALTDTEIDWLVSWLASKA